jgi:hypothetical protein
MVRDMSRSNDGDVVIMGMMAEASMESVALGMAVTATAFVVVAKMTIFRRRGARAARHVGDGGCDDAQVRLAHPGQLVCVCRCPSCSCNHAQPSAVHALAPPDTL